MSKPHREMGDAWVVNISGVSKYFPIADVVYYDCQLTVSEKKIKGRLKPLSLNQSNHSSFNELI